MARQNALPTGSWGRPPRLTAPPQTVPPVEARPPFRPTPPPPRPPDPVGRGAGPVGGRSGPIEGTAGPASRRSVASGWRRAGVEAAAGLAVLVLVAGLAWPHQPRPLGPAAAWSQRAAPAVNALAIDIASAGGPSGLTAVTADRLAHDLGRVEQEGPPPDGPRAAVWDHAISQVHIALAAWRSDPASAHDALDLAALELAGFSTLAQAQ